MYKNILMAIDFSEVTEAVSQKTLLLREITKADVHLCYVLGDESVVAPASYFYYQSFDFNENVLDPLKKKFAELAHHLSISEKNTHFLRGNAKEEILNLSKKLNIDAIIVGGHDHSRLGMLGSVAAVLSNKADCDVLIVKK
ncbi:universal stress protein [Fluviispira sanaruensis]|uniref:Universal stress protein n=1 Tax=Fluviispira sanaruensis TaxID=2493639 RepID=A0A4P2VY28_FLUSA|nr:universal stress protein [Fluviispira sanaruensis]BBH54585.1 universal stress protein [Fluviispira sanaruensis]